MFWNKFVILTRRTKTKHHQELRQNDEIYLSLHEKTKYIKKKVVKERNKNGGTIEQFNPR
jgi:uncharacterized protein YgiM (DUF1202 family)